MTQRQENLGETKQFRFPSSGIGFKIIFRRISKKETFLIAMRRFSTLKHGAESIILEPGQS